MRHLFSALLVVVCFGVVVYAADTTKAKYVGGTLSIAEKTDGTFDFSSEKEAVFRCKAGESKVPYSQIESIEYGQKAGRRVGAAVVVSPLFLLSKKRKHYVTVGFTDTAGTKQGAVFEVEKGGVYRLVTTLSSRSGKSIDYESEEARKHLEKEKK